MWHEATAKLRALHHVRHDIRVGDNSIASRQSPRQPMVSDAVRWIAPSKSSSTSPGQVPTRLPTSVKAVTPCPVANSSKLNAFQKSPGNGAPDGNTSVTSSSRLSIRSMSETLMLVIRFEAASTQASPTRHSHESQNAAVHFVSQRLVKQTHHRLAARRMHAQPRAPRSLKSGHHQSTLNGALVVLRPDDPRLDALVPGAVRSGLGNSGHDLAS